MQGDVARLHHVDRVARADVHGRAPAHRAQGRVHAARARALGGVGHVGAVRPLQIDARAEGDDLVGVLGVHQRRLREV